MTNNLGSEGFLSFHRFVSPGFWTLAYLRGPTIQRTYFINEVLRLHFQGLLCSSVMFQCPHMYVLQWLSPSRTLPSLYQRGLHPHISFFKPNLRGPRSSQFRNILSHQLNGSTLPDPIQYKEILVTDNLNKWELGTIPIVLEQLHHYIRPYPNHQDKYILLQGFFNGFRLNFTCPRIIIESKTLKSAQEYPDRIQNILDQEIQLGRMDGPYAVRPFSNSRTSPIGIVPKKTGDLRLITHLSTPGGHSMNDFLLLYGQVWFLWWSSYVNSVLKSILLNCKYGFKINFLTSSYPP